jgi:hypothetical protein
MMMLIVIHIVLWNGPSVMSSQIDDTLKQHRVRRWWRARSQLFRIGAVIMAIPVVIVIGVAGFPGVHQALQPDPPPPVPRTAEGYRIPYTHLDDAHLSYWDDYKIVDSTHVRITIGFTGPVKQYEEDCYRNSVSVKQSSDKIVISLYTQNVSEEYEYCRIEPGTFRDYAAEGDYVIVDVGSPINGRKITDGRHNRKIIDDYHR